MKKIFYLLALTLTFNTLLLNAQTGCPNLVTNGDFELPNATFNFGLPLNAGCANNTYSITTRFNLKCANLPNAGDHTTGSGKFLVIQGSNTATNMWATNVTVTPNTPYTFSFWLAGALGSAASEGLLVANLAMVVNGVDVPLSIATTNGGSWIKYTYSGTTPATITNLAIAIRQITAGLGGSDYGIDDISFQSCASACNAEFTFQNINACGNVQFTNTSVPATGLTYFWIFGDPDSGGNNSTAGQSPTHQFTTCGTYNVCLTITGTDCSNTICHTVTIVDNVLPVITCPPNKSVTCVSDTIPSVSGVATATDNCPNVRISYTDVVIAGNLRCEGALRRTWTATDNCGNTATCTQTISVFDNMPPTIVCPPTISVNCSADTIPSVTGLATATDNCGTPTLSYVVTQSGVFPCNSALRRTWTATDNCGKTATCFQLVSVNDKIAPIITCPPNTTVSCAIATNTTPTLTGTATATDNCGATPTITSSDQNLGIFLPCNGIINRTWTAQDACGNTSTCLQVITVIDRIPPTIVCPPNVTVTCATDTLPSVTGTATATDNCTNATLSRVDTLSGTLPCDAVIRRTWRARDVCGNVSSCVQTIFVRDNVAPTITCPANMTVNCIGNINPSVTGTATATDNCSGSATTSYTDANIGVLPCDFYVRRTWTARDACGNTSTCQQAITPALNPPVITCPANITVQCGSTDPSVTGTATATFDCGTAPISYTDVTTGTSPCTAIIQRTWRATACRSATCVQTITVKDAIAPTIVCPQSYTVNTNAGQCYYTGPLTRPTGTDNCDQNLEFICSLVTPTGSTVIVDLTQFPKGVNTISCFARDDCGNVSAACTYTLTVVDNQPPTIICPSSYVLNGTFVGGVCKATLNNIAPTVSDNCPMVTTTYSITGGTISSGSNDASGTMFMGTSQVTYTATDMAGLTTSCSFSVLVKCEIQSQGLLVTKYNDLNCNGKRDSVGGVLTDPGVNGFNFTITNTATGVSFTNTTSGIGQAFFSTLAAGTYTVTETPKPGWIPTNPASGSMTVVVSGSGVTNISFGNCSVCTPTPQDSLCNAPIDVLFVVDNSGSMGQGIGSQFDRAATMITNAIGQMQSVYTNAKYSIVHFGGPCGERIFIEHDFKSASAITVNRQFPPSPGWSDDLNAAYGNVLSALNLTPLSTVYPPFPAPLIQRTLNQRAGSKLLIITFSDAAPNVSSVPNCTNSAMLGSTPALAYQNANALKSTKSASMTVVHMFPIGTVNAVSAAIASPGGIYNGVFNNNNYDYNGGVGPRQYHQWSSPWTSFNILPSLPKCDPRPVDCCDSLMVMPTTTTTGNTCCTSISIKNKVGAKIVKLEASLVSSTGWQFQSGTVSAAAGFNWAAIPNYQTITLGHSSGQLPIGTSNAALTYCLTSNSAAATATQTVVFTWYAVYPGKTDTVVLCRDTVKTNCSQTAGQNCIALVSSSVNCNPDDPYKYDFSFSVQNFTGSAMNQVVLQGLPAGYGFSYNGGSPTSIVGIPLGSLANNAVSGTLTVQIVSSFPVLSPTQICFKLGFASDSTCCFAKDSVCVTLRPCCDPCAGIDAIPQVLPSTVDGCCYKLDLKRVCKYRVFSKVETEVLTPGVIFGYHALGGPDAANWTVMPGATTRKITYAPLSGLINQDLVDDIIQFCLDSITSSSQIPQTVVVRWITGVPPMERVLCTDTLVFNCNKDYQCVKVVPKIECLLDSNKYKLTMTVTNQSSVPFNATHFMVNVVSPSSLSLDGGTAYPLIPSLPSTPGFNTTTVTTYISSSSGFPTTSPYIILSYRLGFLNSSGSFDTCCFDQIRDTILIPPCRPPACKCGTYSGLNYRPTQGAPQQFVTCGDTLIANCTIPNWTMGGNFQCMGDSCPSVIQMKWILRGGGTTQIGTMTGPNFNISIPTSYFTVAGLYNLELQGICGSDTCRCIFIIRATGCPCCQNRDQFVQAVNNAVSILVDNTLCKATINIGALPSCDEITNIQWGDGTNTAGPFGASTMPMHTYTGSGTYYITFLAIERNPLTGLICFEYQKRDSVRLVCNSNACRCGTFSNLNYRPSQGAPNTSVVCGDTLAAPCIPGFNWTLNGNFQCAGADTCRPTGNISWVLRGGTSGILLSGTTSSVIGISIPSSTFSTAGLYTLTLTAICGTDTCRCTFRLRSAGCTPIDNCPNVGCTGNFTWQQLRNDLFIKDMVVFNGKLVVGGSFTTGGFNNIAQWDGTTWTALGTGLNGGVDALAVHGGKLYAGGSFTSPGSRIAVWDGSSWSPLGSGINGPVNSLVSYGGSLVAGGSFTTAGSGSANNIARWDGISTWSNFGIGMNGVVKSVGIYNTNLVAGGLFTSAGSTIVLNIAEWNGTTWSAMAGGIIPHTGTPNQTVTSILQYGTDLIVAGRFASASSVVNTQSIAKWNGTAWNPMAAGLVGVSNTGFEGITDLKIHAGALYVGGRFTQIGGLPINAVARWTGTNWLTTGATDQLVQALESYAASPTICLPYSAGEIFINRYACTTPTHDVNQLNFRIIPNPNDGNFTIELTEAAVPEMIFRIIDPTGRFFFESEAKIGSAQQTIKTDNLPNGMYFLQVITDGKVVGVEKFVKQ